MNPRALRALLLSVAIAGTLAALNPNVDHLAAQMLPPEPERHATVSETLGVGSLWVNPAALGMDPGERIQALGMLSFRANPDTTDLGFRQGLVGIRAGPLALGLRTDRFRLTPDDDVTQDGSGFTVGVGWGGDRFSFGATTDQYRRGITSSRFELGAIWRPAPRVTLGAAWRDVGSPVVITQRRPGNFLAGATVGLPGDVGTTSLDAQGYDGGIQRVRGVLRFQLPIGLQAKGLVDLDGDGNVARFTLGMGYRFGDFGGFGTLGRETNRRGGDANEYTVGATAEF
jgi:hypothetical protein